LNNDYSFEVDTNGQSIMLDNSILDLNMTVDILPSKLDKQLLHGTWL